MPESEAHTSGRTKIRHQQEDRQRVSSPEQIAIEPTADQETALLAWEPGLGGAFSQATFERHARLLGDPRMSQSMYARQRTEIVRKIQRDYGNRYVQRLVDHIQQTKTRDIQTKLTVGPAGDTYEREADQVARQAMGIISANSHESVQRVDEDDDEALRKPLLQRQGEEEEEAIRAKPLLQRQVGAEGGDAGSEVDQAVDQARGHGSPLPDHVRGDMETAFGADFSGVKVHTGGESDALNNSVSARAFTTGQDIFFRNGDYNPGSKSGQELIAHELTHVVQQGGGIQRFYSDLKKAKSEEKWEQHEVVTYIDGLFNTWKGILYPKGTRIKQAMRLLKETPPAFKDMVNFRYRGVFYEDIGKEKEEAVQNYIPEDEIPGKIDELKGLVGKLEKDLDENVKTGGLPDQGLLEQIQAILSGIPADESDEDFERVKAEWSKSLGKFEFAAQEKVTTEEEEPEEEEEEDLEILEIEVTFAKANWEVEGFRGPEGSFEGSHGSGEASLGVGGEASAEASVTSKQAMAKAAAELFTGAKAKLTGKASFGSESKALELKGALEGSLELGANLSAEGGIGLKGIKASIQASAFAGLKGSAEGKASLGSESNALELGGALEGSLGLGAEFSAEGAIGLEGIKASIQASAFAGLKGSAEGTATLKLGGRELASLTGKLEGTIGAGGEANLNFTLTHDDLVLKFGASATWGIGGGGEMGISMNLANIVMTTMEQTSKLRLAYLEGYRRDLDVQQIENEATMRRSIAALKSMIEKLETRVQAIESGSETVSLLQGM